MNTLILAFLPLSCAQFEIPGNTINLHTNFEKASICNPYDEAAICSQIVVDKRMSLIAVSHRCSCPQNWKCPEDIEETKVDVHCEWDEERFWHRCRMRCEPIF